MKKGPLNFLGRKNQSLFDTNVKMKDMDNNNVELVLDSGTILESGTASVRARPTVKHYSSSSDSFQGFAVPTPTVPLYTPAVNGTKFNGSVSDDQSSNGSTISVSDPIEGDIFVPPPPSMAPPPPPEFFMLPPPEFMGDLSNLQPPPMSAPKPPSRFVFREEDDFAFLMPPPMSPPKPPSTGSNGSSSVLISSPLATVVPEHPKYAPPQPPTEKQKTFKSPPPKPIRISSVQSMDLPPESPAPPPPVHTPTPSTFNPQSPAKLYSAPKSTFRNGFEEQAPTAKPKLFLQDSGAGPLVENNAKVPTKASLKSLDAKGVTDVKPDVPKPAKEVRETDTVPNISVPPPPSTPPEPIHERTPLTAATLKEFSKTSKTPSVKSAQDFKIERIDKPDSPSSLSSKLRNASGPSAPKDTSPLALLMAAKQRERHKSGTSNENSLPSRSLSTNSGSSWSLNSQEAQPESPKPEPVYASVNKSSMKSTVSSPGCQFQSTTVKELSPSLTIQEKSPNLTIQGKGPNLKIQEKSPNLTIQGKGPNLTIQEKSPNLTIQEASPSQPSLQVEDDKPDLDVPFLPPPPQFDDFEDIQPPPAMPPPDPPKMAAPTLTHVLPTPPPKTIALKPSAPIIPTPPKPAPAPAPPPLPQLPPVLGKTAKAKPPPVMAKPKPAQVPLPTATTPSQTTLLNILKKKMMEMDHKISNDASEQDLNSDDWGSPEDYPVPVTPKVNLPKNTVVQSGSPTVDMNELQSKVTQKSLEKVPNRIPIPTSNGPSRHQYGMTWTVRPGTKQPITLVRKGES